MIKNYYAMHNNYVSRGNHIMCDIIYSIAKKIRIPLRFCLENPLNLSHYKSVSQIMFHIDIFMSLMTASICIFNSFRVPLLSINRQGISSL